MSAIRRSRKPAGDSPTPEEATTPVAAIRSAIHDYLTARHGLPGVARTPHEVEAAVAHPPAMAAVVAVLKRCDATRFSPVNDDALSLTRAAADAVEACEREAV